MTKVFVITSIYPSFSNPGKGRFVKNLLDHFNPDKFDFKIVVPLPIGRRSEFFIDNRAESMYYIGLPGFVKKLFPSLYLFVKKWSFYFINFRKLSQGNFSIVYSHFFVSSHIGYFLSLRLKCFHILAIGENSNYLTDTFSLYPSFSKLVLNMSSYLISVSETNRQIILNFFPSSESRIHVMPNGVDHSIFFKRDKNEMRNKHGISIEQFVISFIGHLDYRKGSARLMEAVNEVPNCGVILMGKGDCLAEFSNPLICGQFDSITVAELLCCSDLFVLPTLAEGWCNAINEAMACGLPICSSNIDSIREQLDGVKFFSVDPLSVIEIRTRILEAISNEELLLDMSLSSLRKSQCYRIEIRAERISNLFDSLLLT